MAPLQRKICPRMIQHCQHCCELSGLEADSWGEHGERSCHSLGVNIEGKLVEGVYKAGVGDQLNVGSVSLCGNLLAVLR